MNYFLDLSCDREIQGNNAIFLVLLIAGLSTVGSSFLNDNIGRKWTFIVILIVAVSGSLLSVLFDSYFMIVLGMIIQTTCKLVFGKLLTGLVVRSYLFIGKINFR